MLKRVTKKLVLHYSEYECWVHGSEIKPSLKCNATAP